LFCGEDFLRRAAGRFGSAADLPLLLQAKASIEQPGNGFGSI
jgi:hypothetical protein